MEISYFARAHSKSAVVAVCEVEGGPAYDVELTAEAHAIKYSLESTVIDVGRQPFDRVVERQLALRNEGKVKFPFRVNLSGLTRASIASVDPVEGVIPGESEVTFRFKVKIGIPDAVDERIAIHAAHFDPIPVAIVGEGVYQIIALSLPRLEDDEHAAFLQQGEALLLERGPNSNLPERFRECWVECPDDALGELTPTTLLGMTNASRPMTARTKRREANKGLYLTNAPFLSNVPTGRLPRDLVPPTPTPDPSRASTPDAADWGVEGPSYVPTTHEIAHEADRLRLRRDLILRDEERAARLMERAAATGLDLPGRTRRDPGSGWALARDGEVRVGARDDGAGAAPGHGARVQSSRRRREIRLRVAFGSRLLARRDVAGRIGVAVGPEQRVDDEETHRARRGERSRSGDAVEVRHRFRKRP